MRALLLRLSPYSYKFNHLSKKAKKTEWAKYKICWQTVLKCNLIWKKIHLVLLTDMFICVRYKLFHPMCKTLSMYAFFLKITLKLFCHFLEWKYTAWDVISILLYLKIIIYMIRMIIYKYILRVSNWVFHLGPNGLFGIGGMRQLETQGWEDTPSLSCSQQCFPGLTQPNLLQVKVIINLRNAEYILVGWHG